jgi:hypothetical protein
MDQFITFRSRREFPNALRLTAQERGIPVSQLIRETLSREIKFRPAWTGRHPRRSA